MKVLFTNSPTLDIVLVVLIAVAGFAVYFLPSIIAHRRRHRNYNALLAVNFLLGFSGIAWVVCLAWALWKSQRAEVVA